METKNINIINIEQMFGSAIQQSTDGSTINMPIENIEAVKEFLDTIDTTVEIRQIQNAYINGKTNAEKLSKKYFGELLVELKSFQNIQYGSLNRENPWGNNVEEEILKMIPLRDKMIDFLIMIYENATDTKFITSLLKSLLQVSFDEYSFFNQTNTFGYISSDHKRNFIYEIFLYLFTYLLKTEKYEEALLLLDSSYQMEINNKQGFNTEPKRFESHNYTAFNLDVVSIDDKFRRIQNGLDDHFMTKKSLYADLIKKKCYQSNYFNFDDVVSTDALLFFISVFRMSVSGIENYWLSRLHSSYNGSQNEIMLKGTSINTMQKILPLFGVHNIQDFSNMVNKVDINVNNFLRNMHWFPRPNHFLNYQYLNTQA